MTARTTYEASVKSAAQTQISTVIAAETTKQTTIDAALTVAGYTLQSGNYGNLAAAIKSANAAKLATVYAAEVAKLLLQIPGAHQAARTPTHNRKIKHLFSVVSPPAVSGRHRV